MRTTRLVSALLVAGGLSALGLASLHAQSPSQTPQQSTPQGQQPTFRSTTDVVAVDVSVVDKDGRPVDNLKPEDFTLKVDGKGRRLTSAEFVSLRHQDDDAKPAAFSSNQGERPGRLIMIVIDEANIHKGTTKNVFTAAATFVDNLNPSDRVAVQLIPGSGPLINFTSNHVQVKSVLESAAGQSIEADDTGRIGVSEAIAITDRDDQAVWNEVIERECAGVSLDPESVTQCQNLLRGDIREVYTKTRFTTISTLLSLRQIIGRLGLTPEPKTLVLISEGLVVERNLADTSWIGPETAAAQVSIYGIRLSSMQYDALMGRTSPTREQDKDLLVEGMERIVAEGRGAVMPVAGNPNVTFSKLSTELSGYYLLSFEPTGDDRDGKTHQIGVDVARRGVFVRARKEFSAEPAGTKHTADELLTDTLRSALIKSDFGLKLTSYSLRDENTTRIKLMIGAEIDRTFEPTGPIALAYYVSDASGALVSADVVKNLAPEAGQNGQPQLYMAAVSVDPGTYSIKLAAADADGRVASVERTASAKLTAVGQVRMGDLLIARPNGAGGVRPTVDGVVGTDAMVGYLELYSDAEPQLEQSTVTLEIAQSDSGTPLASAPMPFADNKPGRRVAEAAMPVGLLANGDYIARAVLSQNGRTIGTISQPFKVAHDASHAHANGPAPAVAPARTTPIAITSRIDHFDRGAVLTRPVVGFFLDHLGIVGLPPLPADLTSAVGLARAGQFAAIPAVVASAQTPHFAAPFLNGLAALAAGDLKGAATLFGDSIKLAPAFYPAAFYLGACYAAAGQDADATKTWELSLVKDPAAPWFYTLLSDSMLRQHQVPQALEILKAATALWPADDDITLRLGTALSMDGRPAESLDVLDTYFTRHGDDSERLLLAMRMIYDARSANQPIQTLDADRARFAKYYEAYRKSAAPISRRRSAGRRSSIGPQRRRRRALTIGAIGGSGRSRHLIGHQAKPRSGHASVGWSQRGEAAKRCHGPIERSADRPIPGKKTRPPRSPDRPDVERHLDVDGLVESHRRHAPARHRDFLAGRGQHDGGARAAADRGARCGALLAPQDRADDRAAGGGKTDLLRVLLLRGRRQRAQAGRDRIAVARRGQRSKAHGETRAALHFARRHGAGDYAVHLTAFGDHGRVVDRDRPCDRRVDRIAFVTRLRAHGRLEAQRQIGALGHGVFAEARG